MTTSGPPGDRRLELLLAVLLLVGTWCAASVVAAGLCIALAGGHSGTSRAVGPLGMRVVTAGVALFILLPILRVVVMLVAFIRERDMRFSAIAALVLAIICAAFLIGMHRIP